MPDPTSTHAILSASELAHSLMLSRIQFAANMTFHILFPTISLALGWVLLFFKLRFDRAKNAVWMDCYKFWVKVFALTFALGVVSGITMSFQFGTNWPGYMETVGNIAGPLLAYEVLTAFFLEATFLGIMLFGTGRVSNRIHTLATVLVAFGTSLSAFWILALNSWMQTPAGFEMRNGRAFATDWLAVVFNPSLPYRYTHMMIASGLTVAFLLAGLSAYRWRRGDHAKSVTLSLKTGLYLAAFLIPIQIAVGDMHGLNTREHQPAKIAAIEAIWNTEKHVPLVLFALLDAAGKTNRFSFGLPGISSLILTHDLGGEIKGLNEFGDLHPPVAPIFWSFRIMVGMGMLMLVVSWFGAWQMKRGGEPGRLLSCTLIAMSFSGWVAVVAGWYTTEIGRQPWLVSGVLKTVDAVAKSVTAPMVATTLTMYLLLYAGLILAYVYVVFYLARQAHTAVGEEMPVQGFSSAAVAKEVE